MLAQIKAKQMCKAITIMGAQHMHVPGSHHVHVILILKIAVQQNKHWEQKARVNCARNGPFQGLTTRSTSSILPARCSCSCPSALGPASRRRTFAFAPTVCDPGKFNRRLENVSNACCGDLPCLTCHPRGAPSWELELQAATILHRKITETCEERLHTMRSAV